MEPYSPQIEDVYRPRTRYETRLGEFQIPVPGTLQAGGADNAAKEAKNTIPKDESTTEDSTANGVKDGAHGETVTHT